ncbi:MAG: helix-turn-helix domain-containing protein [Cyanobacteria bacterium]|nr:helix-turn-helix domain-containing protein [Cyanobacteriota bacterium]
MLAVTRESVLDIAISIGFQNHETFCRAFKRRFGAAPSEWRRDSARHQKRWLATRMHKERGASELSEVSFLSLKPMTLLAMRRLGQYGTFGLQWRPERLAAARRDRAPPGPHFPPARDGVQLRQSKAYSATPPVARRLCAARRCGRCARSGQRSPARFCRRAVWCD